jgi:putative spermidine/putrescine transport system ATP-binding protein
VSQAAGAVEPSDTIAPGGTLPDIRLRGLTKRYGDFAAVDGVDLEVAQGEFFTLLGPSGSGKTTTLRLIAGFAIPDAGTVELRGSDVTGLPPYARDVNTVFSGLRAVPAHVDRRQRRVRPADREGPTRGAPPPGG